jgi:glycosyltransferase 2 family protein
MHKGSAKHKNKIFTIVFPSVITLTIFYLLIRNIGIGKIVKEFSNANLTYVFYAFMMSLVLVILSGQKLKLFIEMMGYEISFLRCQEITIATYAFNVIIPSKGGDLIKCWSLRDIISISRGAGMVILERFLDIILLCLMAFIGSLFIKNVKLMSLSFLLLLILMICLLLLCILRSFNIKNKFLERVKGIGFALESFFNNYKYSLFIILIGTFIWVGSAFQIYILYIAVGQKVPFLFSMAVVPVAIFIGLIPVSIGGMGTRDAALIYLFSAYASESGSLIVGLFFSLLRYWFLALLGIPFLGSLKSKEPQESA